MAPDPYDPAALATWMMVEKVEEGLVVSPKSGPDGLNPCITLDANTMTTQFTAWTMPKGPFLVWKQSKPS